MDEVPAFGPDEARRFITLVAQRHDLPQTGMGKVSLALEEIRETIGVIYGEIVPALMAALADSSADPERIRLCLRDLHYAFRGVDWYIHEEGWAEDL